MVNDQNGPHGQGTAVDEDGWRYEGTFKDGSLVEGKEFTSSGALRYEGGFSGGNLHGIGTRFNSGGDVDKGRFEECDLFDGTRTYPNGTVLKCVNGNWRPR